MERLRESNLVHFQSLHLSTAASDIADVINNLRHRGCAAQTLAQGKNVPTSTHEVALTASAHEVALTASSAVADTAAGGSTNP